MQNSHGWNRMQSLSGALDIDNANNKHCLETFVCEKDVCVGDLGASCIRIKISVNLGLNVIK